MQMVPLFLILLFSGPGVFVAEGLFLALSPVFCTALLAGAVGLRG